MKIRVKVKPYSKKSYVEKKEDYYQVYLKKPAQDGKANTELVKVLKKYFGKQCKIVRGFKSREKIVEID